MYTGISLLGVEPLTGGEHLFVCDVVVVIHKFVDDAVGGQFNYAVAHSLDKFVVVAREQQIALEALQSIVECLD